jgi:hypothetical protein
MGKGMSLTVEQIRDEWQEGLYDPDHVTVRVRTSRQLGFCLPDPDGSEEEFAVFNVMSFGDNYAIDRATSYEVEIGQKPTGGKVFARTENVHEYRRLIIKRNLVDWTLDIPIERNQAGWMTPKCYARVSSVPAPLMDSFVRGFEESTEVTEEEEQQISRQCALLFSKSGQGVTDACEAVSKFCTIGNFSEKFGINREMLAKMPYREFLLLKIMVGKENDSMRVRQHHGSPGGSKIVGPGGKAKASRGVRIPMPGSG